MGKLSRSFDRYKLLLKDGHQVRAKIGSFISQAEFNPQILTMKVDSGFGNIEHIGDFLAGFAVFDQ